MHCPPALAGLGLPATLAAALLLAASAAAAALAPSQDGQEILDPATHLAWSRCLLGQRWTGRACGGTPELLRHTEALARARALAQQSGRAWRLPRVPELQRLVRRNGQGLDPQLFPDAPADWHWSGTPSLSHEAVNPYNYGSVMRGQTASAPPESSFVNGWAVHLGDGQARDDVPRGSRLAVRLVRSTR
ncbi:DUF1566 domain-containing protein [Ideonella sp. 4Y16]|uniref:DUF1566 domain-containing protein n=1 Tax=Ideonella alba TaxID=2824118 RepID=A0A940Y926_9BURK|nr:DUF1566 domain-containing protein [Ideonella alba]MBQ0929918.1 DUF1566 domain-containing protein [Ideonella alba]MBQ0942151.1 DUF1566 domain-containing protein [Ideonella alba]